MATFKLTALELSGETGLTLTLRTGASSSNADSGDALTETGTTGYFTASPTVSDGTYFYFVIQSSLPIYRGVVTFSGGVGVADDSSVLLAVQTSVTAIAVQTTAIEAQTDLIGTGSATVASPVTADGELTNPIIIGDDYLAANGRSFEFTITEPTGFVAATSTCSFGGEALNGTGDTWLVTGSITDNGSTWLLKFDLTKTVTGALSEGLYKWSVEVTSAGGTEHTVVRWGEEARVVDKQT